jgi:hypothetical protein
MVFSLFYYHLALLALIWFFVMLHRIFPADFGERRTISEGYLNSCSFM